MLRFLALLVGALVASSGFWKDIATKQGVWPGDTIAALAVIVLTGFQTLLSYTWGEGFGKERRAGLIELSFKTTLERLKLHDPAVRVSVMRCSTVWWNLLPRRGLRFVHRFGFDRGDPDYDLVLLRKHGITGLAIEGGQWAMGFRFQVSMPQDAEGNARVLTTHTHVISGKPLQEQVPMDRGMSAKQCAAVKSRNFVLSYPIRNVERDEKGTAKPLGKIIGVICVDSANVSKYLDQTSMTLTAHARGLVGSLKDPGSAAGYIFD